jgi:hypothetical protein
MSIRFPVFTPSLGKIYSLTRELFFHSIVAKCRLKDSRHLSGK